MYKLMMNCGPACGCRPRDRHGRLAKRTARVYSQPLLQQPAETGWMPAIDVREDKAAFYLLADLPGVRREDVKLELEDGLLTLSAERRQEPAGEGGDWRWVGRQYGMFSRRFRLPRNADADNISAELKDGVLQVRLPKSASSVSKQVSIA